MIGCSAVTPSPERGFFIGGDDMNETIFAGPGVAKPDAVGDAITAERQRRLFELQVEAGKRYPAGTSMRCKVAIDIEAWGGAGESVAAKIQDAFERISQAKEPIRELALDNGVHISMRVLNTYFEDSKFTGQEQVL